MVTKGHNLSTMLSGVYDSRVLGKNRRDWCGHKNSEWAQFLCKWQDSFSGPSSPDGGCQESECWVLALPQSGFFVSHTFLADRYPWDHTHLILSLFTSNCLNFSLLVTLDILCEHGECGCKSRGMEKVPWGLEKRNRKARWWPLVNRENRFSFSFDYKTSM